MLIEEPESERAENLLIVILGEQAVIMAFFLSGPMWQISLIIYSCELRNLVGRCAVGLQRMSESKLGDSESKISSDRDVVIEFSTSPSSGRPRGPMTTERTHMKLAHSEESKGSGGSEGEGKCMYCGSDREPVAG